MKASPERVAKEFDQIAALPEQKWNHNIHYHPFILRNLPSQRQKVLEIGCGKGLLSADLAKSAQSVVGLDLSSEMLKFAKERCKQITNLEFLQKDYLEHPFPEAHFDAIVSVATLHHMDWESVLLKVRKELKVGGKFLVVDLYEEGHWSDFFYDLVSIPLHRLLKFRYEGRTITTKLEAELWHQHGSGDEYHSIADLKKITAPLMPRARIRKRLLWRYTLAWEKPIEKSTN